MRHYRVQEVFPQFVFPKNSPTGPQQRKTLHVSFKVMWKEFHYIISIERPFEIAQREYFQLRVQTLRPMFYHSFGSSQTHKNSFRRKAMCTKEGCLKAFKVSHHLKAHLRSHTGEKPYTCRYASCSKKFSTSYARNIHYKGFHIGLSQEPPSEIHTWLPDSKEQNEKCCQTRKLCCCNLFETTAAENNCRISNEANLHAESSNACCRSFKTNIENLKNYEISKVLNPQTKVVNSCSCSPTTSMEKNNNYGMSNNSYHKTNTSHTCCTLKKPIEETQNYGMSSNSIHATNVSSSCCYSSKNPIEEINNYGISINSNNKTDTSSSCCCSSKKPIEKINNYGMSINSNHKTSISNSCCCPSTTPIEEINNYGMSINSNHKTSVSNSCCCSSKTPIEEINNCIMSINSNHKTSVSNSCCCSSKKPIKEIKNHGMSNYSNQPSKTLSSCCSSNKKVVENNNSGTLTNSNLQTKDSKSICCSFNNPNGDINYEISNNSNLQNIASSSCCSKSNKTIDEIGSSGLFNNSSSSNNASKVKAYAIIPLPQGVDNFNGATYTLAQILNNKWISNVTELKVIQLADDMIETLQQNEKNFNIHSPPHTQVTQLADGVIETLQQNGKNFNLHSSPHPQVIQFLDDDMIGALQQNRKNFNLQSPPQPQNTKGLLERLTEQTDICRCDPCYCDPTKGNECSCNPVADSPFPLELANEPLLSNNYSFPGMSTSSVRFPGMSTSSVCSQNNLENQNNISYQITTSEPFITSTGSSLYSANTSGTPFVCASNNKANDIITNADNCCNITGGNKLNEKLQMATNNIEGVSSAGSIRNSEIDANSSWTHTNQMYPAYPQTSTSWFVPDLKVTNSNIVSSSIESERINSSYKSDSLIKNDQLNLNIKGNNGVIIQQIPENNFGSTNVEINYCDKLNSEGFSFVQDNNLNITDVAFSTKSAYSTSEKYLSQSTSDNNYFFIPISENNKWRPLQQCTQTYYEGRLVEEHIPSTSSTFTNNIGFTSNHVFDNQNWKMDSMDHP